jgi:xanthine dehydrogenase/oxidase
MYQEGDVTHYGQTLYKCTVRQCWDECLRQSKYYERLEAVEAFNRYLTT